MKYAEASELSREMYKKQRARIISEDRPGTDKELSFMIGYEKGTEDIIRILCDRGVIDNSDDLKREAEGGY